MSSYYTNRHQSKHYYLEQLESNLKSSIFGQDEAITQVVNKIMINKAGLSDINKPIASFLFTGPTGVGKTELAIELANNLNLHFERFDMSEYVGKYSTNTLLGGEKSLVGHEEGGLLTNAITKHPNCVLLLDEIEKAHYRVFNTFLQILDYGTLTDKKGNKVDFTNVIIIMTSNLGATAKSTVGFASDKYSNKNDEINKFLSPEFRARIDTKIEFNPLSNDMVESITNKFLNQLSLKLNNQHKTIVLTPLAIKEINTQAYSSKLGARYISKIINDTIKQRLAYELLFGDFKENNKVTVDFKNDFEYIFENELPSNTPINKKSNIFQTAQEAHDYARANPGVTVTRAEYGDGYIIKE